MAIEAPRICVVGSSNIDLTFRTSRLPRPGETLAGHAFQLGFGGKGANQAVMAARLGARVTMISRVGRDLFGSQIQENYLREGIDISQVRTDNVSPSGVAAIVVDDAARNCILVVPGANLGLSPADVRHARPAIEGADAVLAQLEVPIATVLEAFRLARAVGRRTILNPAPAQPLPDELLGLTDLCIPNETEIEQLTGQAAGSVEEAAAAAWSLLQRGPGSVIVTLGQRGALLADARTAEHIPATPVQTVDPSGAGDAFIGSLAVFLVEGASLAEAARRASGVAAFSVTRLGTQSAFPMRMEAEAFLTAVR